MNFTGHTVNVFEVGRLSVSIHGFPIHGKFLTQKTQIGKQHCIVHNISNQDDISRILNDEGMTKNQVT